MTATEVTRKLWQCTLKTRRCKTFAIKQAWGHISISSSFLDQFSTWHCAKVQKAKLSMSQHELPIFTKNISKIKLIIFFFLLLPELGYKCLNVSFSPSDFKQVLPKGHQKKVRSGKEAKTGDQQSSSSILATTDQSRDEIFVSPQEGCVRVFQQLSNLEKHMSFENCIKSSER